MSPDLERLRALWRTRDRLVLLQLGFGDGAALLRIWQAWQQDAGRCARLQVIAIDATTISATAVRQAHAGTPLAPWAERLAAQWPPPTRNLHILDLDVGRLQLLLARGEALGWLHELRAEVDVFWVDAVDLSADPQQGPIRLARGLARLAAPEAWIQLATPSPPLQHALRSAGFDIAKVDSIPIDAVYRPRFAARKRPTTTPPPEQHALIVGAGLAGCALACALAEKGWHSTLIDRREGLAQEASGNPAGMFHGTVNAQDGAHARFNRAAALQAQMAVQQAIDDHGALGGTQGLLRLESTLPDVAAMRALIDAQRLPPDYVQALDATQASERCGLRLRHPAWFYPGGGWVQPAALARSFLQRAGRMSTFRGALAVHRLRQVQGGWQLLDDAGQMIGQGGTLVLANAADALRLLGAAHWPVRSVRGQISLLDNAALAAGQRLRLPRIVLAGAGYLLPSVNGLAVFGASAQVGDMESGVRAADHEFNLQRLQALSEQPAPALQVLSGRVGWRCVANDRLPLVGAVPDEVALAGRHIERLREVPRREGLYVLTALASRGIGWSALGARLLAAQISGAALPLEASLVRALDPARFALRSARRAAL